MIDPRTVCVAVPCYSGRVIAEQMGSLIASVRHFAGITIKTGVSDVALARNFIVAQFLKSQYEWLVTIDDDIAFTPPDFEILMQPMDPQKDKEEHTRVICRGIKTGQDAALASATLMPSLYECEADTIVCAEYSYKDDQMRPCRGGLGFTRIHRSVFTAIEQLKHDDGTPRTWQFLSEGMLCTDFFPRGSLFGQIVPSSQWVGEDHGFFTLARMAKILPRIETRTRLWHVGTKAYPYMGDIGGAQ